MRSTYEMNFIFYHLNSQKKKYNYQILSKSFTLSLIEAPISVESDQKTPFSIPSTSRCWVGWYSFPWIAPLTPDLYLKMPSVLARKHQALFFDSLVWLEPGLNPVSRAMPNTLTMQMDRLYIIYIYIYIYICVCVCVCVCECVDKYPDVCVYLCVLKYSDVCMFITFGVICAYVCSWIYMVVCLIECALVITYNRIFRVSLVVSMWFKFVKNTG